MLYDAAYIIVELVFEVGVYVLYHPNRYRIAKLQFMKNVCGFGRTGN